VISPTENSNKFQKAMFWKEKLVEEVVKLGPMAQPTLVCFFLLKNLKRNLKNYY
jgi:hypothetical protein